MVSSGGEDDNGSALHRRVMIAQAHGSLACGKSPGFDVAMEGVGQSPLDRIGLADCRALTLF